MAAMYLFRGLNRTNGVGAGRRFRRLGQWAALFTFSFACASSTTEVEKLHKALEQPSCHFIPAVQDYMSTVSERVEEEFWNRLTPPAREKVRVVLRVTNRGSLISTEVRRARSPEIEALMIDAVRAAAPFPPPPDAYWDCLVNAKVTLLFDTFKELDCEDDEADKYVSEITELITDEVFRTESRHGHGWVRLDIDLAEDGSVTNLSTKGGSSPAARYRVALAVEQVQPLPAPPAAYRHCFVGTVFLSILVPGS
jgi:hypothetical protein